MFLEAAPFLLVDDVVRAADYYRDKLGFEVGRVFRRTARLCHRPAQHRARDAAPDAGETRTAVQHFEMPHALDLYIWVSDVQSLAQELKTRGARIVNEPELEDGRREMLVNDLDGYLHLLRRSGELAALAV